MGTVANSLTSTASTPVTASGSSSTAFTGTSQYSQDFQNVITRAVAIASLPITLLTNQQTTLTNQSTALTSIDTDFTALQTAVAGIQSALEGSSFQTTVSAPTVVSASVADGAQQGNYTIQVNNPGVAETSLTTATWASTGAAATYTLVVGSNDYTISATDDSAATVASTINAQYGNLVDATVVNVGTTATPDYRISLQSAALGPVTVDIENSAHTSLQTQQNASTAALASYEVDGSGVTETSDTASINIATGLTLNLLADGTTNVTVTRSTSTLSDALSAFANAYNKAATDVAAQHGTSDSTGAGPLQGQAIIFDLSEALSTIGIYNTSSGSGQVSNLEQLGLDLGVDGQFTYSPLTMASTDLTNSTDVNSFLGSSTANANSLTTNTWASTGAAATYTLVVGGSEYSVSATDDSAATVASTQPEWAIEFPSGLPGFEARRRFAAIKFEESAPLIFLQSLEDPALCFITLPVLAVDPQYKLAVSGEDLGQLGLAPGKQPRIGTDVLCLTVIAIRESGPTANLLAPIVVNLRTLMAVQAVAAESEYSLQHVLLPEEAHACS
jgi:flagellar assembly factor FliW